MIGIDLEENDRFKDWNLEKLKRVFSKNEIDYANSKANPTEHFCGFYCVREALVKALDKQDIVFNKIIIKHSDTGKPYFEKNDYMLSLLHNLRIKDIEVSISHSKNYAVGLVLIEKI